MTAKTAQLYSFFLQEGFFPVGKESFPRIQNFKQTSILLDLSATLTNTWGVPLNSLYKNIRGCICVVWFCDGSPYHGGSPLYYTILCPQDSEYSLKQVIDVLYDFSLKAALSFLPVESIDEQFLEDYTAVAGYKTETGYSDDHVEYVYKTKDLLELPGGINLNKRSRLKKFSALRGISLAPLTKKNVRLCCEIEEEWCKQRECSYCESFAGCEKKALEIMVDIFDEQIHRGLVGYIDGNPAGYAIWEQKNNRYSYLYFGKSNVRDFFLYLIYRITQDYLSGVEYFNIGEDMGNPGLRTFKKHLGVHELWRKYFCNFTKAEK
jgi:hypothetical protein